MNKIIVALAACAIGAQIVYPLVSGSTRDVVTVAVVGFLAVVAVTHAAATRGLIWATVLFVGTAGLGLVAEMVGTATGFPFGSYFYATDRLGPNAFDVPLVVPLAWTAGFYPIWCAITYVSTRKTFSPRGGTLFRVAFAAIGMVGWDLYLDTQMVTDGQWTWTTPIAGLPGIPSIPVSNYLGWLLVSLVMATLVEFATRQLAPETISTHPGAGTTSRETRQPLSDTVPIVLFLWTWLGSALAHAVLLDGDEMHFSAPYGFVVMGIVGFPLVSTWIDERRRTRPTSSLS